MLIDFVVENYRSIKEPVTLSAIAQARSAATARSQRTRLGILPDNDIAPAFPVEGRGLELLPVLGIFGANASGKSNLVRALSALLDFVFYGSAEWENLNPLLAFTPFALDNTVAKEPTKFELRVVLDGTIYTYYLALNQTRILEERLEYMPPPPRRKSNRLLFERKLPDGENKHIWKNGSDFGTAYKEIQESLRDHEPFMGLLVRHLNIESIELFADWLKLRWQGIGLDRESTDVGSLISLLDLFPAWQNQVSEVIRRFDTGISRIEIEASDSSREELTKYRLFSLHDTENGSVRFPFKEESLGTQHLFVLMGKTAYALQYGTLLIVDELDSHIHPHVTQAIVRLFQNPNTNPKHAQFIFTSHDNTLQQRNLLRRDQIWFTQKRRDGSTELYSLSDFHPRNDLAIDKAYLDGRFGAVPIIPNEEDLLPILEKAA